MRAASLRESANPPRPEPRMMPMRGRKGVRDATNCAAYSACVNWSIMRVLQIAVRQEPAVAVALQPVIEKCLVEIRGDDLFSEFVGFGTNEGDAQSRHDRNERLGNSIGRDPAVRVFAFDLTKRGRDHEEAVGKKAHAL